MLNKSLFSSFSTQENDFKDSIVFKFIYVSIALKVVYRRSLSFQSAFSEKKQFDNFLISLACGI